MEEVNLSPRRVCVQEPVLDKEGLPKRLLIINNIIR